MKLAISCHQHIDLKNDQIILDRDRKLLIAGDLLSFYGDLLSPPWRSPVILLAISYHLAGDLLSRTWRSPVTKSLVKDCDGMGSKSGIRFK
jgi:hypothetical protein